MGEAVPTEIQICEEMQQVAMKYRMRAFGLQVFKDCLSYEVREDGASPLGASSTTISGRSTSIRRQLLK
jgi:hypothetical protein